MNSTKTASKKIGEFSFNTLVKKADALYYIHGGFHEKSNFTGCVFYGMRRRPFEEGAVDWSAVDAILGERA